MGDVVNLNQFRKRKRRDAAESRAGANRVRHGRTKAERARDDAERRKADSSLDASKLVGDDED